MIEKIAFKNWAKNLTKMSKNVFLMHFVATSKNVRKNPKPFLDKFFLTVSTKTEKHLKWSMVYNCKKCFFLLFRQKICIPPKLMTEKLAVEVDVKKYGHSSSSSHT